MSTEATTTTLFVRNIPYSWFDRDLERCFEHIGPIRRAFCVTTRGKKAAQALGDDGAVGSAAAAGGKAVENNRGFGFIEFATHADALRAVEEMNDKVVEEPSLDDAKKNKSAGPKKLHVELSVKKGEKPVMPKKDETPAAAADKPKPEKKGVSVKDIKLDAKTLEKKAPVTKAVSDSETSESEDEEEEKEKQKAKQKKQEEEKKAAAAKTVKKETPAAPVAAAPTKPAAKVAPTPAAASAHTPTSTARPTPTPSTADSAAASSRTVLISGINPTVKNINEHLKGLVSNISKVLFPSPESTLKYKAARLTFDTDALADAAVGLLDKKLIKGDPIRCIKLNNESKANRLIIRNLPWLVGEKRLHLIFRDCCAPLEKGGGGGTIISIDLPKEADGKSKGFGFISFSSLAAAELALKKTGTILNNRPIAVDWSLSKDDYQNRVTLNQVEEKKLEAKKQAKEEAKAQAEKEKSKSKVKVEDESDEDDIKVKKEEDMDVDDENVDLAADKRKNKSILSSILGSDDEEDDEEEKKSNKSSKKIKQEDEDSDVDMKDESGSDSDDEADEDEDEDDEEGSDHDDDELNMSDDSVSDSDASMSDEDDDSLGDEAAPELDQNATPKFTHPRQSDTIKGCTVFIRNLSYDTTEDKLMEKFSQFGECKYAKVCWDKELDRSRGTAFVQFLTPEVAKKVVGMSVDTSNTPAALYKKNKITAAVATGAGITLDGRVLNIALAVDREQATTLAEKNKEKQKEDKRNLYLANEGNIRPDSAAAKEMPPAELEKREKAFREKKKKLKNPNYCVSRTRLSVRNLPLDADEKVLKRVFLAAARDAVKEQPKNSPLRDGTIGQPVIQQVKLLRATDRLDSKGIGRSKRYGFVEFSHHEHSLLALRALNNNPNAFANSAEISKGKHERPFVEFALEDARKLLIRQQKQAAMEKRKVLKAKQQAELDAANGVAPVEAKKKPALPKSSEQPRKKALKAPVDPSAGGGRGACFVCGEGGHIGRNCPKNGGSGGDDSSAKPVSNGKQHAGNKRKATDAPAPAEKQEPAAKKSKPSPSHGPAATPAAVSTEPAASKDFKGKNKNNKHRDVKLPSHLNDGGKDEAKFEKIVQAHKKKFFGEGESDKIKAAASRWFE